MRRHLALVAVAILIASLSCAQTGSGPSSGSTATPDAQPPPAGGYFHTRGEGAWRRLPTGETCIGLVHRSAWEPRPTNTEANGRMPDPVAVAEAFGSRPRSGPAKAYKPRWDTWLLPRVDGAFTGTTDEIMQWAACKWGLADDLLRAITVQESTWYQYATDPSGGCVLTRGCGDMITEPTDATLEYCQGLADVGGYDYQADHGSGICPKTFSIAGVMSWQDPMWGPFPGNQNGTFPFNRDSTAFAVDYLAASLRGCVEGWEPWLGTTGRRPYRRGEVWGCVGSWYAGAWRTPPAREYIALVRQAVDRRMWLDASFAEI